MMTFSNLDTDCISCIFDYLSGKDLLALHIVNKKVHEIKLPTNFSLPINAHIFDATMSTFLQRINNFCRKIVHVKVTEFCLQQIINGIIKLPPTVFALTLVGNFKNYPNLESLSQITHLYALCVPTIESYDNFSFRKFVFPPNLEKLDWSLSLMLPIIFPETITNFFIDTPITYFRVPSHVQFLKFGKKYTSNIYKYSIAIYPDNKLEEITFVENHIKMYPLSVTGHIYESIEFDCSILESTRIIFIGSDESTTKKDELDKKIKFQYPDLEVIVKRTYPSNIITVSSC